MTMTPADIEKAKENFVGMKTLIDKIVESLDRGDMGAAYFKLSALSVVMCGVFATMSKQLFPAKKSPPPEY